MIIRIEAFWLVETLAYEAIITPREVIIALKAGLLSHATFDIQASKHGRFCWMKISLIWQKPVQVLDILNIGNFAN